MIFRPYSLLRGQTLDYEQLGEEGKSRDST
jgi:hypothetical protein